MAELRGVKNHYRFNSKYGTKTENFTSYKEMKT
jgi:hypothetical protein